MKDLPHVVHLLGGLLIGFSAAYLPPLAMALLYRDGALAAFLLALGLNLLLGLALWLATRRAGRELRARSGFLLVALAWIVFAADAAVPLWLALPELSYTDAYFESMSGFTATGATLLTGIDGLPHAVNLWRHELCWLGGLGVIGLGLAVLPLLGVGGMQVFRAEASGPVKDSRLVPRFVQTARSLWMVYIALTLACALALWGAGMNLFDAICHALSTLSLGGFSTHDAKIGYFHAQGHAPAIEAVLMVFMLLAGINFATHFLALRGRSFKVYLRDPEALAFLALVAFSVAAITTHLWLLRLYGGFGATLRAVAFNVISAATDCGLYSTDYGRWPLATGLWMLLLSCLAVSAGSTGGGIKMIRLLIVCKQTAREIHALLHPSAVHVLKLRGQVLPERVALSALGFIHLYTMSMVGLTFLLLLSGMDFLSAFSAIVATLNNLGPGLREVGPGGTYAGLSDFQTWVCTASMLLGRLEFFALLIPLTRGFWRG